MRRHKLLLILAGVQTTIKQESVFYDSKIVIDNSYSSNLTIVDYGNN